MRFFCNFVWFVARGVSWRRLISLGALAVSLLACPVFGRASPKDEDLNRPKLPYRMIEPRQQDIDAYDSKAEPVANATAALQAVNKTGWEVIRKYFPALGPLLGGLEKRGTAGNLGPALNGRDSVEPSPPFGTSNRFRAGYVNEDPAFSPIPLLCIVWSLPGGQLSGRLKSLHDEIAPAMKLDDYSAWKLQELRKAVDDLTTRAKTAQAVKYRTPKPNVSFSQALRLYAMTLALIRLETKWADKADLPPPDTVDFTNRLLHQLPRQVPDGGSTSFFLYRPNVLNQPLSKEEFEERADVVALSRKGMTIEVEQFPVYLTENQREWSPSWIQPADLANDSTLPARKFDHDWTRLDGPYLWYRGDLLAGETIYRATVNLHSDYIIIDAERTIERRGEVKREQRPRDYDPALMSSFNPGIDAPAGPAEALTIDPPSIEEQTNSLKHFGPYFSNHFASWCRYGLTASGLAPDGKTWIVVLPDEPRPVASSSNSSPAGQPSAPSRTAEAEMLPLDSTNTASSKNSATAPRSRGRLIVELARSIDSKKLKEGDEVEAKLMGVVTFSNRPPFGQGAKVVGHVTEVTNYSKNDPQSTLTVVFDRLVGSAGQEARIHSIVQAVAPNQKADVNTGNDLGTNDLIYVPTLASVKSNGDHGKVQHLTETSTGVLGIKNIKLGPQGVLSSSGKEVRLDSGTQLLLNVTMVYNP